MKRYFEYLLQKNKKIICIILVLFLILNSVIMATQLPSLAKISFNDCLGTMCFSIFALVIACYLFPILIMQKYMNISSVDMVYSFPLKKHKLILSEVLFNWLILFIPYIITCLIGIMLSVSLSDYIRLHLMLACFEASVICSMLYLFNIFILSKCNSIRDALIIEGLYFIVFVLLALTVPRFFAENSISWQVYGIIYQNISDIMNYLSPLRALFSLGNMNHLLLIIIVYLVYSGVLIIAIMKSIQYRKAENSGGISDSILTYSLAVNLITVLLLLSSAAGDFINVNIFLYLAIFVCYCGINFIAQRNFKIKIRHIVLFILCIAISYMARYAYIHSGCFNEIYAYKPYLESNVSEKVGIEYNVFSNSGENIRFDLSSKLNSMADIKVVAKQIHEMLIKDYLNQDNQLNLDNYTGNRVTITYINSKSKDKKIKFDYEISDTQLKKIKELISENNLDVQSEIIKY